MSRHSLSYLEKEVLQASPIDQILLLYNKAITLIKNVKQILDKDNLLLTPEEIKFKAEAISKATDILIYLRSVIDHERGGEIAKNLDVIYEILIDELMTFTFKNDKKILDDTIHILDNLRKAWQDIKFEAGAKRQPHNSQPNAFNHGL